MNSLIARSLGVGMVVFALTACGQAPSDPASQTEDGETRSIFRPEFQVEPIEELQSQAPLETRILFPDGAELTEQARAELATVLASPQAASGGRIILRGHSDVGGSDEANMRASQARADAVAEWLLENGIAEDRVTIIAFGEQNPAAPNALPDGTPNEKGRAANRRVEIEVRVEGAEPAQETATLAESIAAQAEAKEAKEAKEGSDERE